jgi:hypothetical protein
LEHRLEVNFNNFINLDILELVHSLVVVMEDNLELEHSLVVMEDSLELERSLLVVMEDNLELIHSIGELIGKDLTFFLLFFLINT